MENKTNEQGRILFLIFSDLVHHVHQLYIEHDSNVAYEAYGGLAKKPIVDVIRDRVRHYITERRRKVIEYLTGEK